MRISIVIPFYNEEENVSPLVEELTALHAEQPDIEAVLVDDGSTDETWARIQECEARHDFIRGLRSPRNEGQTSALLRGLEQAAGEILVTMDGDLQNDPKDIAKLVEQLDGCDCVCGFRAERKDTWSKRMASKLANRVRNWVTRDGIKDTGCTLKAFKRHCAVALPPLDGAHRFMPAYFKLHGYSVKQVPVSHRARRFGVSKYTNLKRLPRTLLDLFGFWWYRKRYLRAQADTTAPSSS